MHFLKPTTCYLLKKGVFYLNVIYTGQPTRVEAKKIMQGREANPFMLSPVWTMFPVFIASMQIYSVSIFDSSIKCSILLENSGGHLSRVNMSLPPCKLRVRVRKEAKLIFILSYCKD